MSANEKPNRLNNALFHARQLSGDTQQRAAARISISASALSKAERGLDKLSPDVLDRYYRHLAHPMAKVSEPVALVIDRKGKAKGIVSEKTLASVRQDKANEKVLIATSRFTVPARGGQPSRKVNWVVRIHCDDSPDAFKIAQEFKKS